MTVVRAAAVVLVLLGVAIGELAGCGAQAPPPFTMEGMGPPKVDCVAAAVPLCRADPVVAATAQGRREVEAYRSASEQGGLWQGTGAVALAGQLAGLAPEWERLEQDLIQACRKAVQCRCEGEDCTEEEATVSGLQARLPDLFDRFLRWQMELADSRPSLVLRPALPPSDSLETELGYRISSYDYDVDLRSGGGAGTSPSVTHRIRLVRTAATADTLRLRMSTTGSEITLSSTTHECIIEPAAVPDFHYQGMVVRKRIAKVPIRAHDIGDEFDIELAATHRDAFPGRSWEWFSVPGASGGLVRVSLRFPETRPGRNPRFFESLEGGVPAPVRLVMGERSRFTSSPDSLAWRWTLQDPEAALNYEIRWDW
ncbi:MAG: hypothetical protein ACT4PE_06060 [Candidatus Eiseniibacteriota bacterium]